MIKAYKSPYVNGEPLEYILQSTDIVIPIGVLCVQTSTAVGVGITNATTHLNTDVARYFISMQATTGSTSKTYCFAPVMRDVLYRVDHSTAEAVVGTSAQGYKCTVSTSGAVTVGTTGSFRISQVFNTSDTSAQYFTGHFILKTSTCA